ncbi:hypothetical protein FXO38_16080 [Capsicum annuum]|nr:hypothetical protein FXO38_16080 [Capsicum annuum]
MYIKCSNLGYARKVFDKMPERDTVSWNAMIFGYSTVGKLEKAELMFHLMPERDAISWNSMISGYLQNGDYPKSIQVFMDMGRGGIGFDRTTFAVVLKACSGLEDCTLGVQVHGLVVKLGLATDVVTGSAIVDMYSKCKRLDESICFFNGMPEKNWISWSALIAGCVQNDEFADGLQLFKKMQKEGVGLDPEDSSSHILLSNIYADAGMWKEVAEMRKVMRYGGLRKEPGCSWIEIKSTLHMFLVGDKAHPRCKEIYENLDALICEMKRASHTLDGECLLNCEATADEHQHPFPKCGVSCF